MMGLDELNFLKETLLNIDEIDDKISAVNQQTKGFELRVEDKKGIITNRENEINEYKRKVKKGEKSSQDIINLYSNFDSELNQKQITDREKERKRMRKTNHPSFYVYPTNIIPIHLSTG